MDELIFGRRYRVTEKIGTGGMADVFKAVDEVLGRTVAVKVLHPKYAAEPNFVARFRQEAQAAANLSHPNIVNIYDWGRDDETYYIVMEYVRGTDLKDLVESQGALDPNKAAEYASQVCAALAVAHGYDIIHRDIKPHNIVLTPDGTIKVMDFGIARAGNTTMTQTGSVLGTAHYVSPEQAQGRSLGAASDLYSLGIVLYELTTGKLPFDGDSPVAVALKQVNEEPIPPRELRPSIPTSLEAIILRAMRKKPSDRYASAEEMRADLRRFLAGQDVPLSVSSAPRPVDETTVMPAVHSSAPPRVRPVPKRRPMWPWIVTVLALVAVGLGVAYAAGIIGPSVAVPELTGMTEEEATITLQAAGLEIGEVKREFSIEIDDGIIIDWSPKSPVRVRKGSEIDLVVSKGPDLVEIPNVAGMSETDAFEVLKQAALDISSVKREYSTDVAADFVIGTDPPALTEVPKGSQVVLIVSKGVETKKVPNVVGKTRAEAAKALEDAGFKVKVIEQFSETVAKGKVVSQRPDGDVLVDAGSTITIYVSKGVEVIKVPDVGGLSEADAKKKLQDAGLKVQVEYQPSMENDVVLNQNPLPNTDARRGDTVTIYVGKTPGP